VNRWSGGITTELFIFPADASYAERNFGFRISTATVEAAVSEFTSLPGFHRILMVLEGNLKMEHDTGAELREVELGAFDQSAFEGEWKTTGFGEVTDFNVMFTDAYEAAIETISLSAEQKLPVKSERSWYFVFLCSGTLLVNEELITAGSFIISERNETPELVAVSDSLFLLIGVKHRA